MTTDNRTFLDALDVVKGAVGSQHSLLQHLRHILLSSSTLTAHDGRITISAPFADCPLSKLSLTLPGEHLLALASHLDHECENLRIVNTDGRLRMSVGKSFRVILPVGSVDASLTASPFAGVKTDGRPAKKGRARGRLDTELSNATDVIQCDGTVLLATLRSLRPFIGDDASRPWSASVLVREGRAWATNNVVLACAAWPHGGAAQGEFALPVFAVDELLRIDEPPEAYRIEPHAVSFLLRDGAWLRTQLVQAGQWPNAAAAHAAAWQGAKFEELRGAGQEAQAVEDLMPFCPDPAAPVIVLEGRTMKTADGDTAAQLANVLRTALQGEEPYRFRAEPLREVLDVASHVAWNTFPRVAWKSAATDERVAMSGVLLGLRA